MRQYDKRYRHEEEMKKNQGIGEKKAFFFEIDDLNDLILVQNLIEDPVSGVDSQDPNYVMFNSSSIPF